MPRPAPACWSAHRTVSDPSVAGGSTVPLTLVTGPANAAKAGAVLGPLRDRLDEEPVLVVPAFQDVEHSRRELAETGATFGAQVVRFSHLSRLIARRDGLPRAGGVRAPAAARGRGRGAPGGLHRAGRVGRAAGLRARGAALLRRAGAVDGRAAAADPGAARLGRRRAAARRTPRRSASSTARYRDGPGGGRAGGRRPVRLGRAVGAASAALGLGGHAGVRVRLRRLHRARVPHDRGAGGVRARPTWWSRCRSSRAARRSRPRPRCASG